MASRELTFAEEAVKYEIEARKVLSEECDYDKIVLIERGRRIISKATQMITNQELDLIFYKRKAMDDAMSKEQIDDLLADYDHEKTVESNLGVYYLKRNDPDGCAIHTDIVQGKVYITSADTVNGGLTAVSITFNELDLFTRRAGLWTAEVEK